MNRSLKLSMLVALALGTAQAMAVDLGQIQVKSTLGQPLLAEIPLHPANPAELSSLTVQLASSEEFARAGVVGGRTTIPLHFSVAHASAGHPVIRITSSTPVNNPFIDLLIEVNGTAGKSVREYAILLDPPNAPAATAAVSAPVAAPAAPAPHAAAPAKPAKPAAAPRPTAVVSNGEYGPVEKGQTLSGIASSTAPAGVDVQQMMLALQQANPDAFYKDNINALKSGVVLRVPTAADAQAMSVAAALAEVRRQNSDWRAPTPAQPSLVADSATRAATSSAPSSKSSDLGDQLALVSPESRDGAAGQGTKGAGDASASNIRQDLLRTQESVASLKQQGAELKSRLKDLSDINSKNEHLLSLKDNEIAELQRKLAAARKAAGITAKEAPSAAANVEVAGAKPDAEPAATATSDQLQTASASTTFESTETPVTASSTAKALSALVSAASVPANAAPVAVAAEPKPVKPASATPAPASKVAATPTRAPAVVAQPWYMKTWAWAAGAGVVVLLILLAMLGRRRKPAAGATAKAGSSLADRFGATTPAGAAAADGEDVDQEELLDQLAEHPDDVGLHLELVALYYSRRDVDHFEAAAEAMFAHVSDPQQDEWQDVLHMGEDLSPGHPLFDNHPELPVSDEAAARQEFDIDDYADDADDADASTDASAMPPLPPTAPKQASGYNFDFDLTPRSVDSSSQSAPADDDIVDAPLPHDMAAESESAWQNNQPDNTLQDELPQDDLPGADLGEFNDDPIDTKLDLARAYLDMGDLDGARAMLGEVVKEGNQMQRDTAKQLLDGAR